MATKRRRLADALGLGSIEQRRDWPHQYRCPGKWSAALHRHFSSLLADPDLEAFEILLRPGRIVLGIRGDGHGADGLLILRRDLWRRNGEL